MGRWRRDKLLAEIERLQQIGLPPERWPADLGMTEAALARALYRAGRNELARPFNRTTAWARDNRIDGSCKRCGGPKRRINRHYCSQHCYHAVGPTKAPLSSPRSLDALEPDVLRAGRAIRESIARAEANGAVFPFKIT
jgi:hypothetical protein